MKLRFSPTSPFVRKVLATAIEAGVAGRIEKIPTQTADPSLVKDNPLAKVPALVTDDGGQLYDSPVICEYLDNLGGKAKLFPAPGAARWKALRRQALADGIMDATVAVFAENRRPENERSPSFVDKQMDKVRNAVAQFEGEAADLGGPVTIGHVALGCALGYLDLRFPETAWRRQAPKLAKWYETFATRSSMKESAPPAG